MSNGFHNTFITSDSFTLWIYITSSKFYIRPSSSSLIFSTNLSSSSTSSAVTSVVPSEESSEVSSEVAVELSSEVPVELSSEVSVEVNADVGGMVPIPAVPGPPGQFRPVKARVVVQVISYSQVECPV